MAIFYTGFGQGIRRAQGYRRVRINGVPRPRQRNGTKYWYYQNNEIHQPQFVGQDSILQTSQILQCRSVRVQNVIRMPRTLQSQELSELVHGA